MSDFFDIEGNPIVTQPTAAEAALLRRLRTVLAPYKLELKHGLLYVTKVVKDETNGTLNSGRN
jgi:hypothetical protein